MRRSLRQLALVGLMGLLAVAFVSACSSETPPTPTELPTNTPVPTSAPTPTPVPPTATPAPTVAPTTGPDTMPAIPEFELGPDMRWGDLVPTHSASRSRRASAASWETTCWRPSGMRPFLRKLPRHGRYRFSAASPRRRPPRFSWRSLLRRRRLYLKRLKPACEVC